MLQGVAVLQDGRPVAAAAPTSRVESLVGQVIAMLRVREGRTMPLDKARVAPLADRVIAAGLANEPGAMAAVARDLRLEGLPLDDLTDLVIPEAARELGRAWEDDRLSFVEVTLAMTRIQRLLRDALFDVPQDGSGPSVLFALPEGEQHTLGGLVAVRQLRRMGCSACLAIGEKPHKVLDLLHLRRFDAMFVTVASIENLELARDLVAIVRDGYARALPVAVGGAVLCGTDQAAAERIRERTGAAIVTNDLAVALSALNLTPQRESRAETA